MTFATLNFESLSPLELLRLHSSASDELKRRGLTRSSNNPVGDIAERLFCDAFDWQIAPPSMSAADALSSTGVRYQIKSRRLTAASGGRQLGAIRNLDAAGFDSLAAVLFDRDYHVLRAAIIPHVLVLKRSKFQQHTNSSVFMLTDSVWSWDGVEDVTLRLRSQATAWNSLAVTQ